MEKHYYKEWMHVQHVLTSQYGFEYTGIGNNAEECFHRKGDRNEQIYVHTMFCSYYMDGPGPDKWMNRPHDIHIKSNYNSEEEQALAFRKLLVYLDEYSPVQPYNKRRKGKPDRAQSQYETSMRALEDQRSYLIDMAANPNISLEAKEYIPSMYEQTTRAMMGISNFQIQ